MYVSVVQGIVFIEGGYPNAQHLQPIETTIGGIFKSAQLTDLNEVKRNLAGKAKQLGANAIVNFQYGQKSVGILQSLWSRDDVNWYGKGVAVLIPEDEYNSLVEA